jgi:hypothetical protein
MITPEARTSGETGPAALWGTVVILAAAALAVSPELIWGNSCGHDFDFHLVSWFDALNGWRHGIPYPHWTPSANFGAGEPRFVFYSPLTWMLGAALGTVLPWTLVPVALTFVLLAGTGLATRALARQALNQSAAALAGCIAIFCGYPLFTAYERSAFAELAGGVWIPLVLLFGLRNGGIHERSNGWRSVFNRSVAPLAVAIAGAWLSNPTVGVMACYTLAAIALVSAGLQRSWWPIIRTAVGAVLGLGLSAVYLLPAAWEQRWVDIHQVTEDPGQTLENNWLFTRHADPGLSLHDEVLRTASTIVVVMIALTVCALLVCKLRRRLPGPRSWWVPLALVPVGVLLLQFSFSEPLWNLLPDLRFLQFPWRWLLILESPMAVFLSSAFWPASTSGPRARAITPAVWGVVFLCMTIGAGKYFYQPCYVEDTVPSMIGTLQAGKGYIGTNEYEPIGADIGLIAKDLPYACLVDSANTVLGKANADGELAWDAAQETCEATYYAGSDAGPEHLRIEGTAPRSAYLVVRQLTFPAWRIALNGQIVTNSSPRSDGLLAVPVQKGAFRLTADWTATRDVVLARWISILSVFGLTCLCLFERRLKRARLS